MFSMKWMYLLLVIVQHLAGFHAQLPLPSERNKTLPVIFELNKMLPPSSEGSRFVPSKLNGTLSVPSERNGTLLLLQKNDSLIQSLHSNASDVSNNALSSDSNNIPMNSHNITTLDNVPIMVNYSRLEHRILIYDLLDIREQFDRDNLLIDVSIQDVENKSFPISMNISDGTVEYNESFFYLTQYFKCSFDQNDELTISCKNVSIYNLTQYLPSDTVRLEVTNSPTVILSKQLSPHLKKLKHLRLTSNQHRYITKAFVGLDSLETLDLSNNNIMAIKNAFSYLSSLKHLNLSKNSIVNVGMVANALKGLKHLETLVLDHNWRIFRIRKDELKPLRESNVTQLHLFNTTMRIVERGAFEHLPYLELLDLSVNYLDEKALTNVTSSLKNTSIKHLQLQEWVHLNNFSSESLKFLENTSINRLDLSHNYFTTIHKLPYIPSLRSLWLIHCSAKFVDYDIISQLPNLTELVLSNNDLIYFEISASKSLKTLILSYQKSRKEMKEFELPDFAFKNKSELEILDLSKNLFPETLRRHVLFGLKKLRSLSLKNVGLVSIEDYSFETLNSLNTLNLQVNILKYLSNATLFGLHKLTNLYLSQNQLILIDGINPFKRTPSLVNILLDNNRIEKIPRDTFSFTNHLEILILSRNKISPWNEPIFGSNSTVSTLGLSQNKIDYVTSTMLSEFRKITSFLDIGRNPFNCSKCGMERFQNFLNSTHIQMGLPVLKNPDNITVKCSLPQRLQGLPLVEVDVSFTDCLELEKLLSIYSIVLISMACVFFAIATYSCYTYRWYIKYWLFHLQSEVKERRASNSKSEKVYKYDAFVSYNSIDSPWIVSYLIPALENEDPKLKLCIHDRDFEVGRLITENILEAIENSKKVILVLTEEFVRSEWCMFELHMAQHRLFDETRDSLILVKLKQVDKKYYSKNLKYLEKTRPCLVWSDYSTDENLFWEKIRKILGYPLTPPNENKN